MANYKRQEKAPKIRMTRARYDSEFFCESVNRLMDLFDTLEEYGGVLSFLTKFEKIIEIYQTREYYTVQEVADILHFSKGGVYKLLEEHELSYYKPGGKHCFISRRDLNAWMDKSKIKSDYEIEGEVRLKLFELAIARKQKVLDKLRRRK